MTNTISSRDRLSPQLQVSSDLISAQGCSDERKLNNDNVSTVAESNQPLSWGGWRIIHASNGRIRIRAQESGIESQIEAISQQLRQYRGVREVTANQQTGSLAIAFDPHKLSLSQILEYLQKLGIQPMSVDESANQEDLFAEWKSLDFWKEQTISLIPMMTGLAVTSGLGIAGVASIPVYMMAANATRWVIGSKEAEVLRSPTSTSEKIAYSVVHAIPGRIRLNVPRIAKDRAYGRRLERLLKSDAQVTSARINYSAASVAIAYQSSEISLAHWENLMELALQTRPATIPIQTIEQPGLPQEVSRQLEENITTSVSSSQPPSVDVPASSPPTELVEEQSPKTSSLWAGMKTPALSYSLAWMANFPLEIFSE